MHTKRKDLFTGQEFIPKRQNQLFISSKTRNDFHNSRTTEENKLRAFVSEPLLRNHKILLSIHSRIGEKLTFTKEYLKGRGFNFSVLTHFEFFEDKTLPALYNFIYVDLFEPTSDSVTIYRKS
jgi:hypothetical protein